MPAALAERNPSSLAIRLAWAVLQGADGALNQFQNLLPWRAVSLMLLFMFHYTFFAADKKWQYLYTCPVTAFFKQFP